MYKTPEKPSTPDDDDNLADLLGNSCSKEIEEEEEAKGNLSVPKSKIGKLTPDIDDVSMSEHKSMLEADVEAEDDDDCPLLFPPRKESTENVDP